MSQRKHKYSVILNNYNKPSDRFLTSGYGPPDGQRGLWELIELAGEQSVVEGLEMLFDAGGQGGTWIGIGPDNTDEVKARLDDYGLALCSIIPNLWGTWRYAKGTVGAADPAIRRETIDLVKKAMDVAAEVNCPYVGLWPGHDGFDYYMEADYQQMWDRWVEGVQVCADHNPDIKIGLEPKPDEPRAFPFISTPLKALLLMRDIDRDNVGLCLDIGHSLYGHETLGDVVALAQKEGNKLFHCHMNDNYNNADLDMIFGSVHTLEFLEFFYWLRRTGYGGWLSIDLFAYRSDPPTSVAEGVRWMQAFDAFIDEVGEAMDELLKQGDPVQSTRFFREKLFGQYVDSNATRIGEPVRG